MNELISKRILGDHHVCSLSQAKTFLSVSDARYLFSWPLLLYVASILSFSCSCERLLLWAASSLSSLVSAQASLGRYFSFEIGSMVRGPLFEQGTKNDLVPDAEDHKPGTHLLLALKVCGGLRRQNFMLQREALISLAAVGFCRLYSLLQAQQF